MTKGKEKRIPGSFIELSPKPTKAFLRENGVIPQKRRVDGRNKKRCKK